LGELEVLVWVKGLTQLSLVTTVEVLPNFGCIGWRVTVKIGPNPNFNPMLRLVGLTAELGELDVLVWVKGLTLLSLVTALGG